MLKIYNSAIIDKTHVFYPLEKKIEKIDFYQLMHCDCILVFYHIYEVFFVVQLVDKYLLV